MKFLTLPFIFLLCFIVACQKKNIPAKTNNPTPVNVSVTPEEPVKVKKEKAKKFPDVNKFTVFLNDHINDSIAGNHPVRLAIGNDIIVIDTLIRNLYKANDFQGFWSDSAKCHHIITLLENSRYDGLMPRDYGIPGLDSMFNECFLDKKKKNDTLYWKLEFTVTKNFIRYLNHLRFGKTNPENIFKDWDYKRDPHLPHSSAELSELLTQNPDTLAGEFRPQYPMYNTLRSVLYTLDAAAKNNSYVWDKIPYIKDFKYGDTSLVIVKIKHRLLSIGLIDLEGDVSNVFDEDLLVALNYFQQHMDLTPNGKIDKITIEKLNFTLQEIKDVVRVNMERCRWLLKGALPDYYIIVNVADYYLRIYKKDKLVYKTKVVVGTTKKETPLFHSKMSTIEFNPYWRVPISIAGEEILPKLKTDPDYISRNNMELVLGDSVVQITDFSSYSKTNFPFVVRQKPGEDNSLGVVKFLFPNPYSIYFHDTPSKSLFEKDIRAFSHGCIRVQKPLELAAFLLSDQGMTSKDINQMIKTKENIVIGLKEKIPVIITYWTCSTDKKNEVFFFKDIYGRDKLILKELNN